jgi:4-alpha-glucanotransferase
LSPGAERELALLRRLARLYGIQTSYLDMEQQRVDATPEALRAGLGTLDAPVADAGDLRQAINEQRRELWNWRLEPVLVAWEGVLKGFTLRLPVREAQGALACSLHLESGETREWQAGSASQRVCRRTRIRGVSYIELQIEAAQTLPLGYHRLTLAVAGKRLEALVIAAPYKSWNPPAAKRWGVLLPLYALHSQRSRGVGDFADLASLTDWATREGASFVGTLPLLASFLDEKPFDPSPYAPVSRLFWNELFVSPDAAAGVSHPDEAKELNKEPLVDYREAWVLKRRALWAEAKEYFTRAGTPGYDAFHFARPEVEDYARFRGAMEKLGPNWRRWPERQRDGELSDRDYDRDVAYGYAYAQWRAAQQMEGLGREAKARGCGLYLDLPVGVHSHGYDAWRYQDVFLDGMSVGAPPDIVTTSGQNWGFAPLSPEALRRSGYEYVIAYLGHHLAVAGRLRIDHAMGLHRLYCIPHGASARDGIYLSYEPEEMYAILSLESHRNQAAIAGENLGIVPGAVNFALDAHEMAGMHVLSIELRPQDEPPFRPIPRQSVASIGTHDLPPFASFWQDEDIDERVRLGVFDAERAESERHNRAAKKAALVAYLRRQGLLDGEESLASVLSACLALLARSEAKDVLVNLEDLWLETEPQNVPGTQDHQHPNWRRRARYSLEEIETLPAVRDILARVRTERASSAEASDD